MIWQLEDCRLPAADRLRVAFLLRSARWIWPATADEERFAWAKSVNDGQDPPAVVPGQLPVVSFNQGVSTVWLLGGVDLPDTLPDGFLAGAYVWGDDARTAWDDAILAVSRSVPVLFTSLERVRNAPLRVVPLGSVASDHTPPLEPRVLVGRSFGLAFLLAAVSRILNVALPENVSGSAEVDSDGRVVRVDALSDKARAVVNISPRVTRFLVAEGQEEIVRAAVGERLEVVGFRDARAVLEYVFGDALTAPVREATADPLLRRELGDAILRLALGKRGQLVSWGAVRNAADLALALWNGALERHAAYELELARAIAGRHEGHSDVISMPDEQWLRKWPVPLRLGIIAHLVQHCADTGMPEADAITTLAAEHLADPFESHPAQLRLGGALARLDALRGSAARALTVQERLAAVFAANLEYEDVSYPLSEWYRLSAIVPDESAFERAEECRNEIRRAGGFGFGNDFVEFGRCRAIVQLGRSSVGVRDELIRLTRTPIDHIRWSAARWLARVDADATDALNTIDRFIRTRDVSSPIERMRHSEACRFKLLIELDQAVAADDEAVGRRLLQKLSELDPGPIGHLLRVAPSSRHSFFVAERYPY